MLPLLQVSESREGRKRGFFVFSHLLCSALPEEGLQPWGGGGGKRERHKLQGSQHPPVPPPVVTLQPLQVGGRERMVLPVPSSSAKKHFSCSGGRTYFLHTAPVLRSGQEWMREGGRRRKEGERAKGGRRETHHSLEWPSRWVVN